jgi:hypothetical protein
LEDYGRGHEFEGIARHSCKDGAIEEAGAEYDRLGTQVANIVDGVKINGLPKHIARLQHNEGLSDPLRRVPGDAPLKVEHPVEQNLTAMGQANVVEGDASVISLRNDAKASEGKNSPDATAIGASPLSNRE